MRAVFALFLIASTLGFASCASDGPTPEEVQDQFRRGMSGQGEIKPGITDTAGDRDRSDGSAGGPQ